MGNLGICEAFRKGKSSGMFKLYFVKENSFYDSLMFGLFPEDENSTPQTR